MRPKYLLACALAAGCASTTPHPMTAAEHEQNAEHYEATAASIDHECWKSLRHELTVYPEGWSWCWKAEDVRFLQANLHAAAAEREAAARMKAAQTQQASR